MRHQYLPTALLTLLLCSCNAQEVGFLLGSDASLSIDPTSISFGDVPRGDEARRNVTLRHVGTTGVITLRNVSLDTSSEDLSLGTIEKLELTPGDETRIQVVYQSDHDEPDAGTLIIETNLSKTPTITIPITTPGQRAKLQASPGTVDFGIVQGGIPKTINVSILNAGTAPATLTGYQVDGDEDGDFSAIVEEGVVVNPGEAVIIDLIYTPTQVNKDDSSFTLFTDREDVTVTIPAEGEEETPILVVEPNTVQFGWVEPGGSRLVTMKVRNEGNKALDITAADLLTDTDGVAILGNFTLPIHLEPGDGESIGAYFQPNEEIAMSAAPIATLQIRSTDVARDPYNVPFFGAAGIPGIQVVPSESVDFSYVAESFEGERVVTVINIGDGNVAVTDAQLKDATTHEFKFQNGNDLPASLQPGESIDLRLTFKNEGGDEGTEFAQFIISTTDPLIPEYPLDVVARRSEKPTCEPAFVPEILAMGAFRSDTVGEETIKVVNYGSGNCQYQTFELIGCTKVQKDVRHMFDCDPNFPDTPFSMKSAPAFGTILGPGQSLNFDIAFSAPPIYNEIVGRDSYFARLALIMHDPNLPGFKLVAPPGGWMAGVNLRAESALPMVSINPGNLNFGIVRTDCQSQVGFVTVSNVGPMEAMITGIEFEGCNDTVHLLEAPELPALVDGFKTHYLEIVFEPEVAGDEDCQLRITTDSLNEPEAIVDLVGTGVDISHQIDTFDQVPPPKVDVLFVVDDSGSMADEQLMLKQQLPKLVDIAVSWGQDYHLAATTTDTILVQGKFKGQPPFATNTTPADDFADNLLVGIAGYFEEMGLESAWMALSGTNLADSGIACVNAPNQCPAGLLCKSNVCRGPNWGFLRPDAELVIILISDEEDSSPKTVPWYISHYVGMKAPQSGVGVKVHAIVTTPEGCQGQNYGTPGYRYIQAVEAFGGHVASICADDFAGEFEAISNKSFGLKDQFYPSLPPAPESIQVFVDGVPCATGWTWNENTKAVVFEEDSACFPPFGTEVQLEYDVYCANESESDQ